MLRAAALVVLMCVLTACVSERPTAYEVGPRESSRLRGNYARWLTERPRKIVVMTVPSESLSKEARDAGFSAGSVDRESVMLNTSENGGLIFGRPTSGEIEELKFLGFTLESTSESDIFRFHFNPNPRLIDSSDPMAPKRP